MCLLHLQLAFGQLGEHLRVTFASDQRGQHRSAGGPEQVRDDRGDLDQGVFEDLLHPLLVPGALGGQYCPQPGQRAQVPDVFTGHERAA